MSITLTLTTFTPAEAEAITGVSTASQRDWRRRGFLASSAGHARFDAFDLARMLVIRLLSDRGIGPGQTAEASYAHCGDIAGVCSSGILLHAFRWIDAWEGDMADLPTQPILPEEAKVESVLFTMLSSIPDEAGETVLHKASIGQWRARADILVKRLWRDRGLPFVSPGRIFIWWADGKSQFANSLEGEMTNIPLSDPRTSGAIVVLDFTSLASMLQERAGRALCHVEIASE